MGCYLESWIIISLNFICFKLYMFNNIHLISQASPCKFGKEDGILVLICKWHFWQVLIEDACFNLYNRGRTIIALPSWQCSLLGEKRPSCCINDVLFILYVILIYNIILNFGQSHYGTTSYKFNVPVQDQVNLLFKLST